MKPLLAARAPFVIALLITAAGCDSVQPVSPDLTRAADTKNLVTPVRNSVKLPVNNLTGKGLDPFVGSVSTPLRTSLVAEAPGSVSKAMLAGDTPSLIWYATDGTATLCRMTGTVFTGECATVLNIPSPWQLVTAGDMNNDGNPDLIWEASDGTNAVTFFNGTSYAMSYTMMFQIPAAWRTVGTGDFNGDSKTDIVVENTSTGEHLVLYMNGAVFAGTLGTLPTAPLTQKVAAIGDVNGDGKLDLIWQNTTTGARLVTYLNGVTPNGAAATMGTLPLEWSIGGAGDYNGDGKADLIIQNTTDGQRRIQYVSSSGTIDASQFTQLPTIATNWKVVSTAPLNWSPASQQAGNVAWLRAAINNAPANSTVNIPAGTYDLGSTSLKVIDKNNVQILGAGVGQTIIRGNGSAHMIIELENSNVNLTVAHLSIRGGGNSMDNATHGLASGTNHLNLYGARFFDLDIQDVSVGISIVGNGTGYCNDVQITGNYLDNIQDRFLVPGSTSGTGYGIHNDGCTQVRIADNVIKNVDRHSIYQAKAYQPDRPGPGSIVIEHNLIIDHARTSSIDEDWTVALVVARSANVVVANNVIINPYQDAISIENETGNGGPWVVNNVRLIGNTILRPRGADVFLTAGGSFTYWGNRSFHSDATVDPSTPFVRKDVYGLINGSLDEPSGMTGTQGLWTPSPFATTYFTQNNLLQSATIAYNSDPSTWAKTSSSLPWTSFEAMTASPSMVYVVNNRKVVEVNPTTQVPRLSSTILPAKSLIAYADGSVIVASGSSLYQVNLSTLVATPSPIPGTGPIRGMVGWGTKIYLVSGSCVYEVVPSTLAATQLAC